MRFPRQLNLFPRATVMTLVICASLVSQAFSSVQYTSRRWGTGEGLPYHTVQAVTQTLDGYLWLGTAKGLVRFDGIRFDVYHPQNTPGLKNEKVSSLCVDRDGVLWIGTAAGLSMLKNNHFSTVDEPALKDRSVVSLYEARDGALWIGTSQGTFRFVGGKLLSFDAILMLSHSTARSFWEDSDGVLWVATNKGLIYWEKNKETVYTDRNGLQTPITRTVCRDRNGTLWAGTFKALSRLHDGIFSHYTREHGLPDHNISSVYHDAHGTMWVGTFGGLCRWTGRDFVTERADDGESYDHVNQFYEDRERNLWIAAKDGIIRLSAKQFSSYTTRHGLAHHNVTAVCQDRKGNLWAGSWGGGVQRFDDGKFLPSVASFGSDVVLSLFEGRDGSLWVGNDFDGGLFRFKDKQTTHYWKRQGLGDDAIRVLHEDTTGNLWIGSSGALNVFRDGKFHRYTTGDGLSHNTIRSIAEDHNGTIWIGTGAGLTLWQDGKFRSFTSANGFCDAAVTAIREDKEHNVWLGTAGSGIYRFRNGTFKNYTVNDGLFANEIAEILEDDFDNFWISTIRGIFRVSKKDFDAFDKGSVSSINSVSYTEADGMVSSICSAVSKPGAWKTQDGRLWFATAKGLIVADPKAGVTKNELPPPVVIEEILADKKRVAGKGEDHVTRHPSLVTIPPGRGELELRFTALSLRAPEKNRFKYKLEGIDSDWVEAGTRRIAYYNNIGPGNYDFHVIACNNDGIWNSSGSRLKLTLQPHYWQTLWFKSLVSIGSLSIAAGVVRYVTRKRMAQTLERLERKHAIERERSRIAKDIHDDLGASLTRITFLGELAETDKDKPESVENYVQRIVTTARDTVRSLDEIVWAVNPRRDTLNSFVEYVAHYADEFLEKTDVHCRLDLPESVPEIPLSSEVRHSLFLVVKEFLNNSVKHARANEIFIGMKLHDEKFTVEVRDNGCGFDLQARSDRRNGNGLENMRKRVESLGGHVKLDSVPGCGTKLWFEVRLSHLASVKL